jgi:hypothetical protein
MMFGFVSIVASIGSNFRIKIYDPNDITKTYCLHEIANSNSGVVFYKVNPCFDTSAGQIFKFSGSGIKSSVYDSSERIMSENTPNLVKIPVRTTARSTDLYKLPLNNAGNAKFTFHRIGEYYKMQLKKFGGFDSNWNDYFYTTTDPAYYDKTGTCLGIFNFALSYVACSKNVNVDVLFDCPDGSVSNYYSSPSVYKTTLNDCTQCSLGSYSKGRFNKNCQSCFSSFTTSALASTQASDCFNNLYITSSISGLCLSIPDTEGAPITVVIIIIIIM